MPAGDRTGPLGFGPRTGRAAGYCQGFRVPGFINYILGRGYFGGGRGTGGRGWRNRFYASGLFGRQRGGGSSPQPPSGWDKEQELTALKHQAESLENALQGIRKRIENLESKDPAQ
ncbi:MAG TPA: DUF5320 domain-containing protein [Acidobacteriota bacterium]|nr:DUF5320 domain-containing protein [Acidobacteriota bacterium]